MEASPGKDSATGHWELTGVIIDRPFPTYPDGFPREVIEEFERAVGRKVIGNRAASGTEIIQELGDLHVSTGYPIVYTSADSVFQIAAHKEVIPEVELYSMAEAARRILRGEHMVSRVIARPFRGSSGKYERINAGRRDYAVEPPRPTLLDCLLKNGKPVAGAGKISDLFAGRGFVECEHTADNKETMTRLMELMSRYDEGILMVNLVDFDTVYGHRNDCEGFARALDEFDKFLPDLKGAMKRDDACFITSDHGCDPTFPTTDHTREYAIFLAFGDLLKKDVFVGDRKSFADAGKTAADMLGVCCKLDGNSFCGLIVE